MLIKNTQDFSFPMSDHNENIEQNKHLNDLNNGEMILAHIGKNEKCLKTFKYRDFWFLKHKWIIQHKTSLN